MGVVCFFSIKCSSSSEFSVAESSAGVVLRGPDVASGRSCNLAPVCSSQSRIQIRQVSVRLIAQHYQMAHILILQARYLSHFNIFSP